MSAELPRLAVITDIPVERTRGGSLLLHRLLTDYPVDRLLVVQASPCTHGADRQLPGVGYRQLSYWTPRWIKHRFNPLWPLMIYLGMRAYRKRAIRMVQDFDPQVVLTVPDGFLWVSACAVAKALRLPLILLVHDDWPSMMIAMTDYRHGLLVRMLRFFYQRVFGRAYRAAAKRLCISPGMVEYYKEIFGIEGHVLYPNRGDDSPVPQIRVGGALENGPVVAFAGTLHTAGAIQLLCSMAQLLLPINGRLDLYVPEATELAPLQLNSPNVRKVGFLPPAELAAKLGGSAHALLLPASFHPDERTIVSTLFPSKLVDYTAIGIPIIIWGPLYSSAVRWGLENSASAVTFTTLDQAPIRDALCRIVMEPDYALALARGALAAGNRDFDLQLARTSLYRHLQDAAQAQEAQPTRFAINQLDA